MTARDRRIEGAVVATAGVLASFLFVFGLAQPAEYRLRGDAWTYVSLGQSIPDVGAAFSYAGARSAGMPLTVALVNGVASHTWPEGGPLWTTNLLCLALLGLHAFTAFRLARTAHTRGWIGARLGAVVAGAFFFAFPASIAHVTTALSDTYALDLWLLGMLTLVPLDREATFRSVLARVVAGGLLLGLATLVRPGLGLPVFLALGVTAVVLLRRSARRAVPWLVVALVVAASVLPFAMNCRARYGQTCLQDPATFGATDSVRAGLGSARHLWFARPLPDGWGVPDPYLTEHLVSACPVRTITGLGDDSLTGCLLHRPWIVPVYAVKKWIGLLDHFRFDPYLEVRTPGWYTLLSRTFDAAAWVGFLTALGVLARRPRRAGEEPGLLAGATGTLALLGVHTLLHVEDRYGLPMIPLATLGLAAFVRGVGDDWRAGRRARAGLRCAAAVSAVAVFVVQVRSWDAIAAAG